MKDDTRLSKVFVVMDQDTFEDDEVIFKKCSNLANACEEARDSAATTRPKIILELIDGYYEVRDQVDDRQLAR